MKVRFVARAVSQLGIILSDLANKDRRAATGLSVRVAEVVERLTQFPRAFQSVEDRPGVRRVPLIPYPYIMFYRVNSDEVAVVAVAHGARDDLLENL